MEYGKMLKMRSTKTLVACWIYSMLRNTDCKICNLKEIKILK